MPEKKTRLSSIKTQDWRTIKPETAKNQRITNTYLNEQHHEIKRTNICRSKISL